MEKRDFIKLIAEHRSSLLNLRILANKVIELIDLSLNDNGKAKETLKKVSEKDSVMGVFFKISSFLIKLIPLEQQVNGTHLIKQNEVNILLQDQEVDEITEEDIKILKDFIEHYYKKQSPENGGKL